MLEDSDYEHLLLQQLAFCAGRRLKAETLIVDAGFCHGSSGLAYIYKNLFSKTKKEVFLEAHLFWISETIKFGTDAIGIEGYKFLTGNFEDREYKTHKPLLEGCAGVQIVYLDHLYPETSKSLDKCMLLN